MKWFTIGNIETIDSPALVIYRQRVVENIRRLINLVPGVGSLRPHVKTNKLAEVCVLMMQAGIRQFKCATIAEAEMLAMVKAPDVLLAYQPVGPKMQRLLKLVQTYPDTHFSCLTDTVLHATQLADLFDGFGLKASVFIDLDTGMNRTGIEPGVKALALARTCIELPGTRLIGLHAYDGHILDKDLSTRQLKSNAAFEQVNALRQEIKSLFGIDCRVVAGGSPSLPTHTGRKGVECSPGTFVFWDWGYQIAFPDEPFEFAALVISRVISIINEETICIDLGHKAVASENPLPRVHFLNAPGAIPIGHSEEHMVLKVPAGSNYQIGDLLYGVPVHICPTVALYEKAYVVDGGRISGSWQVIARNRSITI